MTGIFQKLMQEHFSRPENILYTGDIETGKEQLESYIWTSNPETSKIKIQSVYSYDARDIDRKPAVYIKRNKWQTQRTAIGDGGTPQVTRGPDGKITAIHGRKYTRAIIGSHTLFCIAKTAQAAELLGTEVFDYMMSFAPVMQEDLRLHRLEVTDIEGVAQLEENTELFVVPVVIAYILYRTWRLEAIAPWLKSLGIDLR